jgi:hypothetical protein
MTRYSGYLEKLKDKIIKYTPLLQQQHVVFYCLI